MNEEEKNQPLSGGRRDFSNLRALGITALAVLLYLLLLDAAFETFWNKSPVKWWVATVVVLYLGGSLAVWWREHPLWQRYTWAAKATASFFVLIGLLAFTVWMPGGLTQGLTLLGLSTPTLLSLVTIAAIAFSAIILFQLKYPHPAIKWAIAVLTAYGVIAFLWGIYAHTPYPSLLRESFWTWLPRSLQGGFIGALVIVPLAVVVEIFNALKATREADGKKWRLQQTLALAMSAVMALSGVMMVRPGSLGVQPSAAQITEPLQKSYQELGATLAGVKQGTRRSPKEIADRQEKLFQLLEEAERQIPRDTFDVKAIVDKVGRDPAKLFQWVRDETYLVPYRGLLRGDKGVLMDRLGNSLDRTKLIVELLRLAGHKVRLAHGTLSEKQAKEVLQKARSIPKDGIPALRPSREIPDDLLQKVSAQNQIDQAQVRKLITNITAEQDRMKEAVMRRVSEQAAFIAAAVGKPKEDLRKKEEAAAIEAIRDHWWVQWQDGSKWVDLDPTLPDAKPGQTLINVQETIEADKLPANLYHEVEVRVIIEQWRQGGLKEVPVLTHNLRPTESFGKHIRLRHFPLHWPKDSNLFKEKNPVETLKKTVLAQDEWLPMLSVGDKDITQSTFTDSGDTRGAHAALIAAGWGFTGAAKKVKSVLESGQIGDVGPKRRSDKPRKSDAVLTAEWIEYEIRVPGQTPRKIRREIFDLIGPAARLTGNPTGFEMSEARRMERGLTLIGETEILPLVTQVSPEFVEHLMASNMLKNRAVLLAFLRAKELNPKVVNEQLGKLKPIPFQLYSLALARVAWSRFHGDVYLDHPNILSYHKQPRQNLKGELSLYESFDIVANDVSVQGRTDADPFLVRLEQGVLDTNAEALLMAGGSEVRNTAEIFAETSGRRIEWLAIGSSNDRAWGSVDLHQDVRTRIRQDVGAGYSVMLPTKLLPIDGQAVAGWWRVDPRSGQTLGIGERGWGVGEKMTLEAKITQAVVWTTVFYLGCMLTRMGGEDIFPTPKEWGQCVFVGFGAGVAVFSAKLGVLIGMFAAAQLLK